MTRKLEFHVEVQELNESGEYAPVEGAIHKLRLQFELARGHPHMIFKFWGGGTYLNLDHQ